MDYDGKGQGDDSGETKPQSQRENSVVIGIDPGMTGAWSVHSDKGVDVFDVPLREVAPEKESVPLPSKKRRKNKKKKKKKLPLRVVDSFALYKAFKSVGPTRIVIEQVGSRPTDARKTAFTFGMAYSAVLNAALACDCPVTLVSPQKWKRAFGLIGQNKDASRLLALKKYPTLTKQLKRKKDHNRSEALLIGAYTDA